MKYSESYQIPRKDKSFKIHLDFPKSHDPDNSNRKFPVVILCHGLLQSHKGQLMAKLASEIKYITCRFDFSGTGENGDEIAENVLHKLESIKAKAKEFDSRRPVPAELDKEEVRSILDQNGELCRTSYGNYLQEADDLDFISDWLQNEKNMQIKAIIGHSKAASVVLIHFLNILKNRRNALNNTQLKNEICSFEEIPDFIMVSGRFDMRNPRPDDRFNKFHLAQLEKLGWIFWRYHEVSGQKHPYLITYDEFIQRNSFNMKDIAVQVRENLETFTGIKILVIHGTADTVVPSNDLDLYTQELNGYCSALRVIGASHFWNSSSEETVLCGQIANFLDRSEETVNHEKFTAGKTSDIKLS